MAANTASSIKWWAGSEARAPAVTLVRLCSVDRDKSHPETVFIPIVLVTGLSRVDERVRGITCGADDFLSKPVKTQELLARTRSLLRLKEFTDELENAETVLFSLALSIEAKDPYTKGHCDRLSDYSLAMADRLGLPQEQRVALRRAGIVHDIGKIGQLDT